MSVAGFDIGNKNCVVAYMKKGVVHVLSDTTSACEMPAIVCFSGSDRKRLFGSLGAASTSSNLRSTISQIKRLIGREYMNPVVQEDLKMLPFNTSEASDGGVLIHLQYLNKKQAYRPHQIMVMIFAHLKQMAEEMLKSYVNNCAIGLMPLRLLHDGCAIALNFGFSPNDFSDSGPTNIVFVDIGYCDTQVTAAAFERGCMKILSHHLDANLGIKDFDQVLFRKIRENLKQHCNVDVCSNTKPCLKPTKKLKKVLVENGYAPYNIECIMENQDLKGFIKREDFEKLCSELLERISSSCNKAVSEAGLSFDKIHALQLVGSSVSESYIPDINRMLTRTFGKEPRRSLNASECVAEGYAIQCALLTRPSSAEYKLEDATYKEEDVAAYSTTTLINFIEEHRMAADLLPPTEKEAVYSQCRKAEQLLDEMLQMEKSMRQKF